MDVPATKVICTISYYGTPFASPRLLGLCKTKDESFMLMEWLPGGSLEDLISCDSGNVKTVDLIYFLHQVRDRPMAVATTEAHRELWGRTCYVQQSDTSAV